MELEPDRVRGWARSTIGVIDGDQKSDRGPMMSADSECWFDDEKLEVYREAINKRDTAK